MSFGPRGVSGSSQSGPSGSYNFVCRKCAARSAQDDEKLTGDEGFTLIVAVVAVFLMLLALSVAAPTIAKSIQHDREVESVRRAQQYVRAIRVYNLKFKHPPGSIEQLEKTNNQRFLRQKYEDPLTGKADWRIIHVGENQTKVKGFFGEDLPGLQAGLGAAAGMASSTGSSSVSGNASPSGSTSAFNNSGTGSSGLGGSSPTSTSGGGLGQGSNVGTGSTGTGAGSGITSQNATDATGSGGGPIMGIGSAKSGEAMIVVNEQTTYDTWEFLYDARIEQLYAKSTLLGGVSSGAATGSGLGNGTTTGNGFGNPSNLNNGFGGSQTPTNGTSPANGNGQNTVGVPVPP